MLCKFNPCNNANCTFNHAKDQHLIKRCNNDPKCKYKNCKFFHECDDKSKLNIFKSTLYNKMNDISCNNSNDNSNDNNSNDKYFTLCWYTQNCKNLKHTYNLDFIKEI